MVDAEMPHVQASVDDLEWKAAEVLRNGEMLRFASGNRAAPKHCPDVENCKRLAGQQAYYWRHVWSVVRKKDLSTLSSYRLLLGLASNHFSKAAWAVSPVDRVSDMKSYFDVEKWSYIL